MFIWSSALIMLYISKMFGWKRFAMISDARAPYQEVAEAIKMGDKYFINSSHVASPDLSDDQVEKIFQLVRKYSRSKY